MFTNTALPAGRTRRSFTRAFKAEVAAQCLHVMTQRNLHSSGR